MKQEYIQVNVKDWPTIGRSTNLTFDERVFANRGDMIAQLRRRYGEGSLMEQGEGEFAYVRRSALPPMFKRLLAFVLNKTHA